MSCLGDVYLEGELEGVFSEIDTNGDGVLAFDEFAAMWTGQSCRAQQMFTQRITDVKMLFNLFDTDGGGELDREELQSIMKRLGRKPSDEELSWVLQGRGDDGLDLKAFVELLCGVRSLIQRKLRKQLRDFREAFQLFDEDSSGEVG